MIYWNIYLYFVSLCALKLWLYKEKNLAECGTRVGDKRTIQRNGAAERCLLMPAHACHINMILKEHFQKNSPQAFTSLHVSLCGVEIFKIHNALSTFVGRKNPFSSSLCNFYIHQKEDADLLKFIKYPSIAVHLCSQLKNADTSQMITLFP